MIESEGTGMRRQKLKNGCREYQEKKLIKSYSTMTDSTKSKFFILFVVASTTSLIIYMEINKQPEGWKDFCLKIHRLLFFIKTSKMSLSLQLAN